jgi:perosamine synthetase
MIEDACQAPLAAWRGKPVGTVGTGGCFSFQASKNITSGEGGAIVTNDEAFAHRCFNFHAPGNLKPGQSLGRAANFRLTEFQAGILRAQLGRLETHAAARDANAAYLTSLLQTIPGIVPTRLTDGCTRSAYHLYMLRYDKQYFAELPRAKFLHALSAAGVSAGQGYRSTLTRVEHVQALAANSHYQRIYGKDRMRAWLEDGACPVIDRICNEAVWLSHQSLLGPRSEMERIAEAMRKVQKNAAELAKG